MGVDVVHVGRVQAGLAQGRADGPRRPAAVGVGFRDRVAVEAAAQAPHLGVDLRPAKPRLAFFRTQQWPLCATPELIENAAAGLGAREIALPFEEVLEAQIAIMGAEAAQSMREDRSLLSPRLRQLLEEGERVTPEQLGAARLRTRYGRGTLDAVLSEFDALVVPAAAGEAPGIESTGDPAFSRVWTLLGAPCVSLPLLKGPSGLPVGLQLVGPPGEDERLLAAADWVLKGERS